MIIPVHRFAGSPGHWEFHRFTGSPFRRLVVWEAFMLRVLLVEDNQAFREAFKEHLDQHFPSMIIEEAETGEEALQKVRETPPRLIFMDIRLPGMNGLQLTQKIKTDFPDICIAVLTGYDLPEYREAADQYGADGFFVKESLRWDEVEALVKKVSV
jgi:DNA-binding NarL/FixJ family response regulator